MNRRVPTALGLAVLAAVSACAASAVSGEAAETSWLAAVERDERKRIVSP